MPRLLPALLALVSVSFAPAAEDRFGTTQRFPTIPGGREWHAAWEESRQVKKPNVPAFRSGKGNFVLYATSTDGLHWQRPFLGLHEFQGSKKNNIIFDVHSPSVLLDEREPDPTKRYKMLGSLRGAYYAAVSPDGLRWESRPATPILPSSDNITLTQVSRTGEYLAYHRKFPTTVRGLPRRVIWLSRSHDFAQWSKPELVFAPDEEDDAWAKEPSQRTEVNNMSVFPHAAGFLGFPTIFRVTAADRPATQLSHGQSGTDGTLDVQLVTSHDGRQWQRTARREPIIPRGAPGAFDAGSIFGVSSTPVHVGDKTWVYYTGISTTHGAPMPPKRIAIGRAEWRRHGFVSLNAEAEGRVETKPLRLGTGAIIVNANAAGGELRAALLEADGNPIPGYSLGDSKVLQSDDTRWPLAWSDKTSPPAERPVRLVLVMRKAQLYSVSVEQISTSAH